MKFKKLKNFNHPSILGLVKTSVSEDNCVLLSGIHFYIVVGAYNFLIPSKKRFGCMPTAVNSEKSEREPHTRGRSRRGSKKYVM